MKINIQLFAFAKELAGCNQVVLEIDRQITAGDLIKLLGRDQPDLQPILPSCRLAVADQFVPDHCVISENDDVSLIPPVSGG